MSNALRSYDAQYHDLVKTVMKHGSTKTDRTGVGTTSLFGATMRFDIRHGAVPLMTYRPTNPKNAIVENLWFLSGDTDVKFLKENNVGIWDEWVIPETAVFRDYTESEYAAAVKKIVSEHGQYNDPSSLEEKYLPVGKGHRVYTYREAINWLRCKEPKVYAEFTKAYPKGATVAEVINFVTVERGIHIPNKKLVSGSIGTGAYGSQWRMWEDTRLIKPADVKKYLEIGYTEIARTPMNGGTVVMTRTIDQIEQVINTLKTNPDSRRMIVSAWNPGKIEDCAIPPCHNYFQFDSTLTSHTELAKRINDNGHGYPNGASHQDLIDLCKDLNIPSRDLSIFFLMRSNDIGIGNPSNVFQYALLCHMVAQVVGMASKEVVWVGVDAHIYTNHNAKLHETLERKSQYQTARIELNPEIKHIDDFKVSDIRLVDYVYDPKPIVYPIAI